LDQVAINDCALDSKRMQLNKIVIIQTTTLSLKSIIAIVGVS
jgi:hypothetical protein